MKSPTKICEFIVFLSLLCLGIAVEATTDKDYRIFDETMYKAVVDVQIDARQEKAYVESFVVTSPLLTWEYYYWMWIWWEPRSGLSCWGYRKLESRSLEARGFKDKDFPEKLRDIRVSVEGIPCLTWDGYPAALWIGNAADHYKTFEDAHQALINRLTTLLKNLDAFKDQSRLIVLDNYLPEGFFYEGHPLNSKFIARLKSVKKSDDKWLFSLEGYGHSLADVVVDKNYSVLEACYPPLNKR